MARRGLLVILVAAVLALAGVSPAQAASSSALVGTTATVTLTGNGFEPVSIGKVGANLTLNNSLDWDSATAGDQMLPDTAAAHVVIDGSTDSLAVDTIAIGTPGTTLAASFTINGAAGTDFVFVYPGGSGADMVTVSGNSLDGPDVGHVAWSATTDQVDVRTGDGADLFSVTSTPTSPQLFLFGEGDDDTLKLANGTALSSAPGTDSAFRGGPGTDTVDYSAWTTPVSVDLGKTARFEADLTAASAVPPSADVATAFADVEFNLPAATFDFELDAGGLTAAQITDAHIHAGAAGSNGAVILPIGAGSTWVNPGAGTTPKTELTAATDPDITEPALRAGNTYVDIHSAAGDIRGQLTLDPEEGYGGSGTGVPGLFTVENVIGGSGNDTLKGSVPHNSFDCGPGQDTVSVDATDALVHCDKGGTGVITPVKPKAKAKGKKVTIDTGAKATCPVTAPSACTLTATATAKLGKKSASFGTFTAAPGAGSSSPIVLKVPKKTVKAWQKAGKAKITFTITITVPDGTGSTVATTVKVKFPKPKKHAR
jgi:hypothetical protein